MKLKYDTPLSNVAFNFNLRRYTAGGGGLIAGIALAVKTINPNVLIVGVEPERCASMSAAMVRYHVYKHHYEQTVTSYRALIRLN